MKYVKLQDEYMVWYDTASAEWIARLISSDERQYSNGRGVTPTVALINLIEGLRAVRAGQRWPGEPEDEKLFYITG